MKERPILFSGPMVRAILDGTKTMTRRIVKPMAGEQSKWLRPETIGWVPHGTMINGGWQMHHPKAGGFDDGVLVAHDSPFGWIRCPYGVPGDRLWVRETHAQAGTGRVFYRADPDTLAPRWTPAIHMPRASSRIDLEITAVRAERLQDITEEDARAEGFPLGPTPGILRVTDAATGKVEEHKVITHDFTARGSFCHLWDGINGKRAAWATNPWCWVVSFKRVSK